MSLLCLPASWLPTSLRINSVSCVFRINCFLCLTRPFALPNSGSSKLCSSTSSPSPYVSPPPKLCSSFPRRSWVASSLRSLDAFSSLPDAFFPQPCLPCSASLSLNVTSERLSLTILFRFSPPLGLISSLQSTNQDFLHIWFAYMLVIGVFPSWAWAPRCQELYFAHLSTIRSLAYKNSGFCKRGVGRYLNVQ